MALSEYRQSDGNYFKLVDSSGPYSLDANGVGTLMPSSTTVTSANTLAAPGFARQLHADVASGTSADTALTTTTRRITMRATGSAIRYSVGDSAQTASATSNFIAEDERLDLAVPANAQIAVLSATTTAAVLELTELL